MIRDCFGLSPRTVNATLQRRGEKGAALPPPFPLSFVQCIVIARATSEAILIVNEQFAGSVTMQVGLYRQTLFIHLQQIIKIIPVIGQSWHLILTTQLVARFHPVEKQAFPCYHQIRRI